MHSDAKLLCEKCDEEERGGKAMLGENFKLFVYGVIRLRSVRHFPHHNTPCAALPSPWKHHLESMNKGKLAGNSA
jgi:hypothetical protein